MQLASTHTITHLAYPPEDHSRPNLSYQRKEEHSSQPAVSQPAWVASDYAFVAAAAFLVFVCAVVDGAAASVLEYWERTEMKDWDVVMVSLHQWIAQPLLPRVIQMHNITQTYVCLYTPSQSDEPSLPLSHLSWLQMNQQLFQLLFSYQ